jgi:hypothetical protein
MLQLSGNPKKRRISFDGFENGFKQFGILATDISFSGGDFPVFSINYFLMGPNLAT